MNRLLMMIPKPSQCRPLLRTCLRAGAAAFSLAAVGQSAIAQETDPIGLSDEFESRNLLNGWRGETSHLDLGETRKGWLTLEASSQPGQALIYREAQDDFVVSARISAGRRENDRGEVSDLGYGGLILSDGVSESRYLSIAIGPGDEPGAYAFEVRDASNGNVQTIPASSSTGEVQVARLGSAILLLYRENGGDWKVQGRYEQPNLPEVLQVGVTAYSRSPRAAVAQVDWVRFRSPELPENLGADTLADAADEDLLKFLGKSVLKPTPGDVRTWRWNVADPVPFRGVEHGEIWSDSMQRMVGYNIYLPPSYHTDSTRRYPVIYFLHGASGDESMDAAVSHVLDDGIRAGVLEEAIMVAPNGGQYSGYRDRVNDNVMAETWIIKELIPTIDERYRTIAEGDARAIGGFSMGGAGSTRLAAKYPEMFCAMVSFSAGVGRGRSPMDSNETFDLYEQNAETIKERLDLYFTVGGQDRAYERHADFLEHLYKLGIPFHYEVHPKVGHNLGLMKELSGLEMFKTFEKAFKRGRAE